MSGRRIRIILVAVLAVIVFGGLFFAYAVQLNCCALPPLPPTLTAIASQTGTPPPYDPVLYATRQYERQLMMTSAGAYTIVPFEVRERELISAWQGTPTATPWPSAAPSTEPCIFRNAQRSDDYVVDLLDIYFDYHVMGYQDAVVRAEVVGEECLDSAGNVLAFMAKATDIYITQPVDSLSDETEIVGEIRSIYRHLEYMLPYRTRAPLGDLEVTLTAGNESRTLRASIEEIGAAIEQDLVGDAFITSVYGEDCALIDIVCEGEATLSPGEQVGVLMASAESTEFANLAQTATAIARATTPPPYDPTLYAQRQQTLVYYTTAAGLPTYVQFYATETAIVSAYQGTVQPTATDAPTNSVSYPQCSFQWARQDLPEVTKLAQIALQMYWVELDAATVRVEAYGENCVSSGNVVQSFGAMTTDFYVTMPVDDLADDEAIAKAVSVIYRAFVSGIESWWVPAPFGYLDITFTHEGETRVLRAMFPEIKGVLEQQLSGKDFLEAVYGN